MNCFKKGSKGLSAQVFSAAETYTDNNSTNPNKAKIIKFFILN